MRLLAPLAPAWLVGLWLLLASEELWAEPRPTAGQPGETLAGGWVVLGALVLFTVGYLAAPVLGRNLAVSTVSSTLAGMGSANDAQRSFGEVVVRAGTLAALYLVLAGFVLLE